MIFLIYMINVIDSGVFSYEKINKIKSFGLAVSKALNRIVAVQVNDTTMLNRIPTLRNIIIYSLTLVILFYKR